MTENLQDELYQLENKQVKGAKRRANIRRWTAKNVPKLSSKYLKDRICKIKQYLNNKYLIINQNILAILRAFLNLQKKKKKNYGKLYTKKTSTAATTEFVWEIPNRKKISNEHFNLCEAEISLDEIKKSINSETKNKPPGNDGLTIEFYKHISNELASVLLDVYDSLGKHGCYLENRNHICHIKKVIKKILQTIDPFHF